MKIRSEIKAQAKTGFMSQYGVSVGALFLVILITSSLSIVYNIIYFQSIIWRGISNYSMVLQTLGIGFTIGQISLCLAIFVYPPVMVGYTSFALRVYRCQTADIRGMFRTGFSNYWRKVGGMLWMELFIMLWSLLFIIPGIVKALSYFMTPYILADCPQVTATDALKLSMRMTYGYKGEIFVMGLSFIGWAILSGLTCGILGILYTGPYMGTSFAGLYDELKRNALERGTVRPEELGMAANI